MTKWLLKLEVCDMEIIQDQVYQNVNVVKYPSDVKKRGSENLERFLETSGRS